MATHQDDELQDVPPGKAGSAAVFVLCLLAFLGSFSLMSFAFEIGSPLLFVGGLLLASAAFFVPQQLLGRPD
ncbi:hypothetical protein [uncultured Cellulomonas sp.]|uniref:hypothetical protein n=1 Tax=uncultured Cellulomonas sp. TaxID=189682 RepID=UPI00263854F9|nr:hypothetical protein [uncultured Cellulomonas sp.]